MLDVWNNEPLIDSDLLEMTEISTSHIAGYSADGKANGTAMSIQGLSRFFKMGFLDNWYPEEVPLLDNMKIVLNEIPKIGSEELLEEALYTTYPIERDSEALRKSIHNFESHRGNYPLRREWHNFSTQISSKQIEK